MLRATLAHAAPTDAAFVQRLALEIARRQRAREDAQP